MTFTTFSTILDFIKVNMNWSKLNATHFRNYNNKTKKLNNIFQSYMNFKFYINYNYG